MRMAKQPLDPLLLDFARWTGVGAALHSQQALMLLQQQLFDYATERYCRALENEGDLLDGLELAQDQKQQLHALLDGQLKNVQQGDWVSPQQTLNKLVALGESAGAAEAARRLRQTLKTLDQSFTPTTPLDSEELWNELMASTGEVLVEHHLLVA